LAKVTVKLDAQCLVKSLGNVTLELCALLATTTSFHLTDLSSRLGNFLEPLITQFNQALLDQLIGQTGH
jgi:hypothetical protein